MGFAAGFQTGAQAVERGLKMRDEDRLREQLAQAYAQPESFTDYTPEQVKEIQRLQATGAYDVNAMPGAEGQVPTLRYTPRQGLELGQGDMPAPPTDFTPQQVQRYGGQTVAGQFAPDQIRGLQMREAARIIGASGDPVRAAQLMQQAEDIDYNAKMRPLQEQATRQQLTLGEIGLTKAKREEETQAGNQRAQVEVSALREAGTNIDSKTLAAIAKKNGADYNALLQSELNQLGYTEKSAAVEMKALSRDLTKAAAGGIPSLNKFLGDKFDPDKSDNISPEVVQTKAGFVVMYGGKQLAEYGSHKTITELVGTVQGLINDDPLGTLKTLTAIESSRAQVRASDASVTASAAAVRASDSNVGLNTIRGKQIEAQTAILNTNVENNAEARKIQNELANLTEETDPTGSKRASLIAQFNMLAVGPGKTIPVGGTGGKGGGLLKQAVDTKKNDDGTYTAYKKDTGEAIYNTYNGEKIPLGMEITEYKAMKDAAKKNGVELYRVEDNGALGLAFVGPDGQPYKDPEKAKYSKPAAVEKPSTAGEKVGLTTTPKAVAAPTPPTARPVREANESLTAFRDRTVAWDQNRMAYEEYLNNQRVRAMLSSNASGLGNRALVQ